MKEPIGRAVITPRDPILTAILDLRRNSPHHTGQEMRDAVIGAIQRAPPIGLPPHVPDELPARGLAPTNPYDDRGYAEIAFVEVTVDWVRRSIDHDIERGVNNVVSLMATMASMMPDPAHFLMTVCDEATRMAVNVRARTHPSPEGKPS